MRRTAESAREFVRRPDPSLAGALLYGPDPILTAHGRRQLARGLLGDAVDDDLAVIVLSPDEVRRDRSAVFAAMTERAFFFSGRRLALFESASDQHARAVEKALEDPQPDDAFLLVTAGDLRPSSSLRKLFEASRRAVALPYYPEAATRESLRRTLKEQGAPPPDEAAVERLMALASEMDWGAFRMLLVQIGTYMRNAPEPATTVQDVDACAPAAGGAEIDGLCDAVASGDRAQIARRTRALAATGESPVSMLIQVTRMFLQLYGMADGGKTRRGPPVHPRRRAALEAHGRRWSPEGLERALSDLHRADLDLRWINAGPPLPILERSLMRVAGMARARRR